MSDQAARVHAPELTGGSDWFNVAVPLTLRALRGKVVLLDFWTYGCVNCMHILPDLKRLEEKYRRRARGHRRPLGEVHATSAVRQHPADHRPLRHHASGGERRVVCDLERVRRARVADAGADRSGRLRGRDGVGRRQGARRSIARSPLSSRSSTNSSGSTARPLQMSPERERLQTSTLAFPGKVLARRSLRPVVHRRLEPSSDSRRDLDGAGDGRHRPARATAGARSGGGRRRSRTRAFYRPQGLALDGDVLYIADTENHLIRAADLRRGWSRPWQATGHQGVWGEHGGASHETPISSPWDLVVANRLLFVAMAGSHQIWMIDLDRELAFPYAGSGREARVDGAVDEAAFAQPSGLALADVARCSSPTPSRTSFARLRCRRRTTCARSPAAISSNSATATVAATTCGCSIRWAWRWPDGRLFIADTYNHRIKVLDPAARA